MEALNGGESQPKNSLHLYIFFHFTHYSKHLFIVSHSQSQNLIHINLIKFAFNPIEFPNIILLNKIEFSAT